MKKALLWIIGLSVFLAACANDTSDDSEDSKSVSKDIYLTASLTSMSEYTQKAVTGTGYHYSTKANGVPGIFVVKGSDLANLLMRICCLLPRHALRDRHS